MDAAGAEEASPSPSRRAAKRPRTTADEESPSPLALPPEVWADILGYLPFDAVLACGAVSRAMLHDAMPLLTTLRIDKTFQLDLAVASRFPDVRAMHINSLLSLNVEDAGTDDEIREVNVCVETKNRVVPFLSRFGKLERVHFGGQCYGDDDIDGFAPAAEHFWEGEDTYPDEGDREAMLAFLDGVITGFRCRALPQQLMISGLCCPNTANQNSSNHCYTCMEACRKFPLNAVVRFECTRSSIHSARSGRSYGFDVCLEKAQIESIIESRPGGHDILRSEVRLLYLLGRGRLYTITVPGDTRAVRIVKYKDEQLTEIKRVIEYAELDAKKLSMQKLSDAVMRSFTRNEGDPIPSRCDRYISDASLDYLVKEIGLYLDRDEICSDASDLVEHAHQIAGVLREAHSRANSDDEGSDAGGDFEDIFVDCLRLVRQFSELDGAHIHQITGAIPSLVKYLNDTGECEKEAVLALSNILKNGTAEHRKMVLENKPISSFSGMLVSSNACTVKAAVRALDNIATLGTGEDVAAVNAVVDVARLVRLLDSEDNDCVLSALRVLAAAEGDQLKIALDEGLLPHISRLILSPDDINVNALATCSGLLRNILEHPSCGKPHVQHVLDAKLIPRLLWLAQTNDNIPPWIEGARAVQSNLAHVMIYLADANITEDEVMESLSEDGLLSRLVNLVEFSDREISIKALKTLGKLAESWDLLELGIAIPLLRLLNNGEVKGAQLRAVSKAFRECCHGFDFGIAKAGIVALTKILENRDAKTVVNCCWALHNILEGLDEAKMSAVISFGFVKRLLDLLGKGLAESQWFPSLSRFSELQEPALKSLCFVSVAGAKCIESITDAGGMKCIKEILMFSSDDEMKKLACSIISNVCGSVDHIPAVVDAAIMPYLLQVLSRQRDALHSSIFGRSLDWSGSCASDEVCNAALGPILQVTETGTIPQVKYLVACGCAKTLLALLNGDGGNTSDAIIALKALRNIIDVGKTGVRHSVPVREWKIEEWKEETLRLQRETERVARLLKKKAQLEYDAPDEEMVRLSTEFERLKSAFRQELGEQSWYSEPSLGRMASSHRTKPTTISCLAKVLHRIHSRHHEAEIKRRAISEETTKFATTALAGHDIPKDLAGVDEALKHSFPSVLLLKAKRSSYQRSLEIDEVALGIEEMFLSAADLEGGRNKENQATNIEVDSVAGRMKRRKSQTKKMTKKAAR